MKLPDIEERDKPTPDPEHVPRMGVELTPDADACADRDGRLRGIDEDATEKLEYAVGLS